MTEVMAFRFLMGHEIQPSIVNTPASDAKSSSPADAPEDPTAQLLATLDSVSDNVAVLDSSGNIVMTNVAWRQFARAYSPQAGQTTPHTDVGSNYLEVVSRCHNPQDGSDQALVGIRAVLSGSLESFCLSYPCHTPVAQHWFAMNVTPLEWDGQRGALVKHSEITPRHRLDHRRVPRLTPNFPGTKQ